MHVFLKKMLNFRLRLLKKSWLGGIYDKAQNRNQGGVA